RIPGPNSVWTWLEEKLLDLGDELGGRRQIARTGLGGRRGLLGCVTRLELLDVVRDLRVLRDDLFQVGIELLHRLLEISDVDRRAEERRDALHEGQGRPWGLDTRDVVRNVGPEARRRQPLLLADRVEDAHDPGGPFVLRRARAEKNGELRIRRAAGKTDGPGVRHLGE